MVILFLNILNLLFSQNLENYLLKEKKKMVEMFYMIVMIYLAEINGVGASLGWYFMLVLLSLIASMISPPVSGGQIIVLGMMMAQLGIPESSMALLGIMSLFMDFFAVALRTGCSQMEIVLQADKLGELDREVLMS